MTIHDITLTISEALPVWPGDPPVQMSRPADLDRGDPATVSALAFGAHTGTHVDAPAHFLAGGAWVETLALETLMGPAVVVDTGEAPELSPEVLDSLPIPAGAERLLFRTRNSRLWTRPAPAFVEDFTAVTEAGAAWLVGRGVRLVGIDFLSIGPFARSAPTHEILLRAGVVIIEGLDLSRVEAGAYQLVCLPLKIADCEGAPARAVLIGP